MSHTLSSGLGPADRIVTRPTRTAPKDAHRSAVPRPHEHKPHSAVPATRPAKVRGVSMDYQLGFTSGPSS